jgi:hypothetical protein
MGSLSPIWEKGSGDEDKLELHDSYEIAINRAIQALISLLPTGRDRL